MKKILIVGNAPLPDENVESRPAAGLRTHQFLKALSDLNLYYIRLVTVGMPECYEEMPEKGSKKHSDRFEQIFVSKDDPFLLKEIQKCHDEFKPDAIIGVNTHPSYLLSKIKTEAPFWADLNGWIMAEAQAQAYKTESNDYLPHYFSIEKSILLRADKVSAVSENQKFAVLGELAFMGRLNNQTFGNQFCYHIPNGTETFEGEIVGNLKLDVPENAFIVLWVGGYNTWADETTLFKGLEKAMKGCENLFFVSTGGQIKGLDNKTFSNFQQMVEKSEYKNRFKFLGWIKTDEIPSLYAKAHVGLNVDKLCTETLTGARNRINEMMKYGLPVITSLGSEISHEVERHKSGLTFKSADFDAFAENILTIYREWNGGNSDEKFKQYGDNGKKYISEECNYHKIMQPLINWLTNPHRAPDADLKVVMERKLSTAALYRYLKENGLKKSFKKFLQKLGI